MYKDCLVSFSSKGREDYNKNLLELLDSALLHWKGDYLIYSLDHWLNEYKGIKINKGYPKDSLTHEEMPYQFKYALIKEALDKGYNRVVWLDTSFTLVKDITPLFEYGIGMFHNLGHPLYKYISDEALELLEVEHESIYNIEQVWGGALFFDFNKPYVLNKFDEILKHSKDGSFKDGTSNSTGFVAHRHDQSVMSVLMRNEQLIPYGKVKIKQHYLNGEYGNDCYIVYG